MTRCKAKKVFKIKKWKGTVRCRRQQAFHEKWVRQPHIGVGYYGRTLKWKYKPPKETAPATA